MSCQHTNTHKHTQEKKKKALFAVFRAHSREQQQQGNKDVNKISDMVTFFYANLHRMKKKQQQQKC